MTMLVTDRLTLRPPQMADADALVRGLGNFSVSRWTGRVPHPYGLPDAEDYIARQQSVSAGEVALLIVRKDAVIGGISITQDELGYWIAEPFWGQGLGREAASAVTDHALGVLGRERLVASYQIGNDASRRILLGLGFEETGEATAFSRARAAQVPIMWLELTRAAWADAKERRR